MKKRWESSLRKAGTQGNVAVPFFFVEKLSLPVVSARSGFVGFSKNGKKRQDSAVDFRVLIGPC